MPGPQTLILLEKKIPVMPNFITLQQIDEAAAAIRDRTSQRPRVGIILGSGLNDLANSVQQAVVIPFGDLPHWPRRLP